MQKLKRSPLLQRLDSTLKNLSKRADKLLDRLPLSNNSLKTIAWIVACLLALSMLSGCAPRTVKPTLPSQIDPRPIPDFEGQTYRDVILYVIDMREGFQSCEADKNAIRGLFGDAP